MLGALVLNVLIYGEDERYYYRSVHKTSQMFVYTK